MEELEIQKNTSESEQNVPALGETAGLNERKKGGIFVVLLKAVLQFILVAVISVLVFAVGLIYIFERGPSPEIKELFVVTVQQSSAAKPLAHLFLDDDEVERIMAQNTVDDTDVEIDDSLISVDDTLDLDEITVEEVHGSSFNGYMMIVNDPSRVYMYTIPDYYVANGKTVSQAVEEEDAIGGVNGGGYWDVNGLGGGAAPLGIVISKGEWRNGDIDDYYQLVGFDNDNKMIIGGMTGREAMARGIRDAIWWGPALIINGEPLNVGNGGGLNPRTAIGQRADGAVLLLVVDGRQPSSIGASYADLVAVMQSYGAVNAANLDGGFSSSMVYEGKVVSKPAPGSERTIPTAVLVKKR